MYLSTNSRSNVLHEHCVLYVKSCKDPIYSDLLGLAF